MMRCADPSEFDAFYECGHRSPEDVLPDYALAGFLAFQLADGDPVKARTIDETMDELEITIAFAYRRTALYLATEK